MVLARLGGKGLMVMNQPDCSVHLEYYSIKYCTAVYKQCTYVQMEIFFHVHYVIMYCRCSIPTGLILYTILHYTLPKSVLAVQNYAGGNEILCTQICV